MNIEDIELIKSEDEYSWWFAMYSLLFVYFLGKISTDEKLNFAGLKGSYELVEKALSGTLTPADFHPTIVSSIVFGAAAVDAWYEGYAVDLEQRFEDAQKSISAPNILQNGGTLQ